MNKILRLLFLLCFFSCAENNNSTAGNDAGETIHANAKDSIITQAEPFVLSGCYQMTMKQDTANLQLNLMDSTVTGKLQYDWNEKDGNTGTIKGVLRDSLVFADYTFESEGLMSVREVIFRLHDHSLIQGFGQLEEKKGKIVFKDKGSLQFDTTHPFFKTRCP